MDPRSLNRYAYAHGNPVNYKDPSGHALGDNNSSNYDLMMRASDSSSATTCDELQYAGGFLWEFIGALNPLYWIAEQYNNPGAYYQGKADADSLTGVSQIYAIRKWLK